MTSSSVLCLGALHAHFQVGFWKSDHNFLIAFHSNFLSGMHGFRDNVVLFLAGCDVIVISPPGGAAGSLLIADSERTTDDPTFILVLHCNYTSIVHRFWFNELFMFAGNYVITISSIGGASGNFWFLKGGPQLYIHVQLTLFVYLERFRRYSTFYLAGISLQGVKIWQFGQIEPQNVNWEKNTCWEGTSLCQTASFEPLCVKLSLSVWPVQMRKKKGTKKSHKKCIFHVCVERPLAGGFQPNLVNVFVSRT